MKFSGSFTWRDWRANRMTEPNEPFGDFIINTDDEILYVYTEGGNITDRREIDFKLEKLDDGTFWLSLVLSHRPLDFELGTHPTNIKFGIYGAHGINEYTSQLGGFLNNLKYDPFYSPCYHLAIKEILTELERRMK